MKNLAQYQARAKIVKALAHPTRLLLVDELARREYCVCELTEKAGADISTVSKHLSLLKNAGLVEDEKHGQMVIYRIKTPCILNFLSCVEDVIKQQARNHMALVE